MNVKGVDPCPHLARRLLSDRRYASIQYSNNPLALFRNPNAPVDVQQYMETTWPEYGTTSQKYINITHNLCKGTVQERFAARQVQFWTKLIPVIEKYT